MNPKMPYDKPECRTEKVGAESLEVSVRGFEDIHDAPMVVSLPLKVSGKYPRFDRGE